MKLENRQVLLSLIRLGVGHASINLFFDQQDGKPFAIDWSQIKCLSEEQGLSAIVLDGIEKMPEQMRPPQILLLEWIGEVLQEYESRYQAYEKSIGEMARFYNSHGFKMMIIKGYACSKDWPKPDHRPCGDIDIWQFGKQKEADATIEAEKPVQVVLCKQSDQGLLPLHPWNKSVTTQSPRHDCLGGSKSLSPKQYTSQKM